MTKTVDLSEALVLVGGDAGLLVRALMRGELSARADTLTVYSIQRSARTTIKDLPIETRSVALTTDFWVGVRAEGQTNGAVDWHVSEAFYVKRWLEDIESGPVEMEETFRAGGVHVLLTDVTRYVLGPAAAVREAANENGSEGRGSKGRAARKALGEVYPNGVPSPDEITTPRLHEELTKHHLQQGRSRDLLWSEKTTSREAGRETRPG